MLPYCNGSRYFHGFPFIPPGCNKQRYASKYEARGANNKYRQYIKWNVPRSSYGNQHCSGSQHNKSCQLLIFALFHVILKGQALVTFFILTKRSGCGQHQHQNNNKFYHGQSISLVMFRLILPPSFKDCLAARPFLAQTQCPWEYLLPQSCPNLLAGLP